VPRTLRLFVAAVALGFLVVHLRALPRTLEDIDSVNFALGVESFDVASHQPHPPGYPIFIGLSKISTAAVRAVRPAWDRDRVAATGLAIWSTLAGTLAVFVIARFWMAMGLSPVTAVLASVVALASPLFWLTASRPLTDTFGLVVALVVQTLFLRGLLPSGRDVVAVPRGWWWGALAMGLAVGVRSQTLWLSGPLFVWVLIVLVRGGRLRTAVTMTALAGAGVFAWLIPMVIDSGGVGGYLRALGGQGTEDLVGIDLLATRPSVRLFVLAMNRTFIQPWQHVALAQVIIGLVVIAVVRMIATKRVRLPLLIGLCFVPYFCFHLAFQETVTIRYALPLVIPMAGLAVVALTALGDRVAIVGAIGLVTASLCFVQPELRLYADAGAPVFRAYQDMRSTLAVTNPPPVLRMHHQVWWGIRRVIDWNRRSWDVGPQPFPGDHEWLGIVSHFRSGSSRPVWLLGDLRRTDISQFDRRGRSLGGRYERPEGGRVLIGGTRLDGVLWWKIEQPAWMLGTGWSLTPEIAGITAKDGTQPARRPAEIFLRRRDGPSRVLVGGRYISGRTPAVLTLNVEGRAVAEWEVTGDPVWFVKWIDLPPGSLLGDGAYASATVTVRAADATVPTPDVVLEQFDAAGSRDVMFALDAGWHEMEHNPVTGRVWRWTSERSVVDIRPAGGRDLWLRISGDSPLRDFDTSPTVSVRAAGRVLGQFSPTDVFEEAVRLPADALAAAGGIVTIETDMTFVPAERGSSPDRRHLGLRLASVQVDPQ
jgi:hypothetical protein